MLFSVFLLRCPSTSSARLTVPRGVNGGVACAVCTAIVAVTEQLSVVHNETFVESYERLCNLLPPKYQNACVSLGKFYIPKIVDILTEEVTADVICHATELCYTEPGRPYCHAFPPRKNFADEWRSNREKAFRFRRPTFDPCTLPGVKDLCQLFKRVFSNDQPLIDLDMDSFSSAVESFRGSSWRGKDCNDVDHMTHPGAKPIAGDEVFDSNCNGIYGVDPGSGKPYEDLLCGGELDWFGYQGKLGVGEGGCG